MPTLPSVFGRICIYECSHARNPSVPDRGRALHGAAVKSETDDRNGHLLRKHSSVRLQLEAGCAGVLEQIPQPVQRSCFNRRHNRARSS
ncbi:unnamed protein product [Hermetia illucens]|uniref:Uncharacterized protein n=1 Tax=Hermetia illucens TaxID=343691 RepID=A0A7R8UWZ0_HERIL|nr:unnamed protein product [Hermetia illucens]